MTGRETILTAGFGEEVDTGAGPRLFVNLRFNVVGGHAEKVVLTGDGREYIPEWHTGPESDDVVYVERWGIAGREFHGWIDRESRRLVQSG